MAGLTLVGTPIGNLGDLSPRARQALGEGDFIAAGDTRVTLKLLNHFRIRKPMVSYHEHNMRQRGQAILGRILAGERCAVVTDAGMPCVSDPGEELVRLCHDAGVPVTVVPGPTAALSALAVSGLPTGRFAFEGFLPVQKNGRKQRLEETRGDPRTLIFYEAPHKLRATLTDMAESFGPDRPLTLVRELTKIHEELIRTTLGGALDLYAQREPKGEFVLVVGGAPDPEQTAGQSTPEEAALLALEMAAEGLSLSEAAKRAAAQTGCKKSQVYKKALQLQEIRRTEESTYRSCPGKDTGIRPDRQRG